MSYPSMTNNLHYIAELVVTIRSEEFRTKGSDIHFITLHQDTLITADNMIYAML